MRRSRVMGEMTSRPFSYLTTHYYFVPTVLELFTNGVCLLRDICFILPRGQCIIPVQDGSVRPSSKKAQLESPQLVSEKNSVKDSLLHASRSVDSIIV